LNYKLNLFQKKTEEEAYLPSFYERMEQDQKKREMVKSFIDCLNDKNPQIQSGTFYNGGGRLKDLYSINEGSSKMN